MLTFNCEMTRSFCFERLALAVCLASIVVGGRQANQEGNASNSTARESGRSSYERPQRPQISMQQMNKDFFTVEHMSAYEKLMFDIDDMHGKYSLSDLGRIALAAKLQTYVYSDQFLHKYDSFDELRNSGGPSANQELCLRQLEHLNRRAERQKREGYQSKDINLGLLLDTFGRVPAGMFLGDVIWIGAYEECLRLKIRTPEGRTPTRYCLVSFRHHSWNYESPYADITSLKSGICLPKSCDSINYKNKYSLVQKLFEFHARDIDKNQANLTSLYCLPDSESPVGSLWYSRKAVLALSLFACWILAQICATFKHERYRSLVQRHSVAAEAAPAKFGLTTGFEISADDNEPARERFMRVYQSLSIFHNMRSLFNTTKPSSLLDAADKLRKCESPAQSGAKLCIVDLQVIEGIKVFSMSYVIVGHTLMCLTTLIQNGRAPAVSQSAAFYMANLVPAFAVNSFFTITGLLTSYLMFKQNQSHSFLTSPLKWLAFIAYRYLRIMPMYLAVILYTKTLAKYAGSGPLWDYGTSALSQRRLCEQESWLWVVLFGANFKSPVEHCIPSAWYLANDFQFFVLTPLFLGTLRRSPRHGRNLLLACIGAGYLAGFLSIFNSQWDDMRPIASFMPHAFKTYISFFNANYTRPQYRMPAYLCGLLIGFVLHNFELDKLRYLELKARHPETRHEEPGWPDAFKRHGVSLSAFIVALCCSTAVIGSRIPFNKPLARLMVAFILPSYHVLFSLSVGMYILLATTGHGNRLVNAVLAAPVWKPLARLSLCAVLINVEVINYIVQSNTHQHQIDNWFHLSLNALCILSTYLAAAVVCLLIEAPIRSLLNLLLSYTLAELAPKKKVQ